MKIGSSNFGMSIAAKLRESSQAISRSLRQLASGQHILSPSDDVAGFSMLSNLQSKIRGLSAGTKSLNLGQAELNGTQTSLESLVEITLKMKDLANQASSGVLSSGERANLQKSLANLMGEYQRIVQGGNLAQGEQNQKIAWGSSPDEQINYSLPNLNAAEVFEKTIGSGAFDTTQGMNVPINGVQKTLLEDFDNDGDLDLLAGHTGGTNIWLNRGDGKFDITNQTLVYSGSTNVGDFNQDGKLDLAISTQTGLITHLGRGDGTFAAGQTLTTGVVNYFNSALDLNNDGLLDLLTINSAAGNSSLFLGNGDGSFRQAATLTLGTSPGDFTAGDINNDGHLDLLFANRGSANLSQWFGEFIAVVRKRRWHFYIQFYNQRGGEPFGSNTRGF